MDFELSAMNVSAMARAPLPRRDEVFSLLSPEARTAFAEPHSTRWHPGRFAVEFWSAVVKLGGKPMLEEYNYQMTRQSFGPVVGPLIKIGMTLSGSTPASMFSRLESLSSVALRGVAFQWKAEGKGGGSEVISYPGPVPADVIDAAWRGVFRVGAELTGKAIRVDRFVAENDRSGRFEVSW